jgi:hypothetical protein
MDDSTKSGKIKVVKYFFLLSQLFLMFLKICTKSYVKKIFKSDMPVLHDYNNTFYCEYFREKISRCLHLVSAFVV